jgi:cytochrome c oxidase assembly factor CtaG
VLLLLAPSYLAGLRAVVRHPQGRRQQRVRAVLLVAGLGTLVAITIPPVGERLETRMWTHMTQHLVIMMVATPLLALARPGQVLLAGMAPQWRRFLVRLVHRMPGRRLAVPGAWTLYVAALWLWHLPGGYDAAVRSEPVHVLEHLSFALTSWLFWVALIRLAADVRRGPLAAVYVAAVVPPGAALGAVLTFATRPLYPAQAHEAVEHGIDPLLDQRIAGLIMWVPLDLVFLALAVGLFARWWQRAQDAPAPLAALPLGAPR